MNPAGGIPGRRIGGLTWPELEAFVAAGAIGVLPVGSGAKAHGPHLPLDTDARQAEWLIDRLIEQAPVLAWPTLTYGHYPAFVDYPGSCSLSGEAFERLAAEVLAEMLRCGLTRVAVLNTGISTIAPLERAVAHSPAPDACRLINVYDGPHYRAAVNAHVQEHGGGHADEQETAIMLAIAPQAVHMDRAAAGLHNKVPGPLQRHDPGGTNYCPSGIHGDPTHATAATGRALLAAMLEDVLVSMGSIERTSTH